jgi:hypothetical protein
VMVKIRAPLKGAAGTPQILLGVLDGSTVRGRAAPLGGENGGLGTAVLRQQEIVVPITGLTPSSSYTFDAAYGVETLVASTQLGLGGPNNATASDAYGAFSFEIWETNGLLGAVHYDPAGSVSKSLASLAALTAMDTTNLRIAFTTTASGPGSTRVFVRLRGVYHGGTTIPGFHLGVLDGSTVRMRQAIWHGHHQNSTKAATDIHVCEAAAVISGLAASTSYTWDAAWAVETVGASFGIKYGGANNTTANDAFGGFTFEVWKA